MTNVEIESLRCEWAGSDDDAELDVKEALIESLVRLSRIQRPGEARVTKCAVRLLTLCLTEHLTIIHSPEAAS